MRQNISLFAFAYKADCGAVLSAAFVLPYFAGLENALAVVMICRTKLTLKVYSDYILAIT